MKYETLTDGFKGRIKKGELVELVTEKHGVATVVTIDKVDRLMYDDLKKVEK